MNGKTMARRDFWAGGLLVALGIAVWLKSRGYGLGSLGHMGSGYFPAVLGILLVLVGILIAATSKDTAMLRLPSRAAWRGASLVLLSVLSFVWVARHLGLVPASFCVVAVAASADRRNSLRDLMLMAGILTLACYLVFSLALHVQMAAFRWEW